MLFRSDLGQNARVELVLACDLQNLPYFGQKLVFRCFRGFENLLAHVLDLVYCVKVV